MTWTKLSDDFADDCASVELSDRAFRTHVEGLVWAMRRETGGFLTVRDVKRGCEFADDATVKELVAAGFWELIPNEGWQILHHMEHQPEPDLIRKRRDATAQRVRRHRRKQAGLDQEDEDDHRNYVGNAVTAPRNAVTERVTRVGSGRDGTGRSSTAFPEDRFQSSSIDRRSTLRANRPPGTPEGELLNLAVPGVSVEDRACRLVGDVLGKTTAEIQELVAIEGDVTDSNLDRWVLMGFVLETVVPALVSGSSDNTVRAQLRKARDEGDITSAWFYTDGSDWKDGTGEWG